MLTPVLIPMHQATILTDSKLLLGAGTKDNDSHLCGNKPVPVLAQKPLRRPMSLIVHLPQRQRQRYLLWLLKDISVVKNYIDLLKLKVS